MKITLWRIGRYRNVSATGFGTSRKGMEVQDAEDKRKKKMKSATVRTTNLLKEVETKTPRTLKLWETIDVSGHPAVVYGLKLLKKIGK